jgi:hypothetical protein
MADHADLVQVRLAQVRLAQVRLAQVARRALAVALAAFCGACAGVGDVAGFAVVTQDQYDFLPCSEILAQRAGQTGNEKQLKEFIAKAESGPGGFIVSSMAYRSELVSARARIAAINRAALKNGCDTPKR